ncbi:MAG: hypothetical protein PHH84_01195 [Oscillospiraceae bacterium]|nr:hypothetical protein [Oscillospiraceae bacterium]MDD4412937.1 hypothetical protein [Oscillospiraceae bacterium]
MRYNVSILYQKKRFLSTPNEGCLLFFLSHFLCAVFMLVQVFHITTPIMWKALLSPASPLFLFLKWGNSKMGLVDEDGAPVVEYGYDAWLALISN